MLAFKLIFGLLLISACALSTLAEVIVVDLEAYYFEGAPDGVTKQILGVNGQFPGPTIRAKIDDTLIIRVTNSIQDKDGIRYPTSIHWHGIEMFLTPWYDGPEAVAQCPIPYGQSMEYRFRLYQAGTYWYHSHHAWQYTDGFWGLLIIDNTPEVHLYDEELAISLVDWYHTPAKILTDAYHRQEIILPFPESGLINGRGNFSCEIAIGNGFECDPNNQTLPVFNIKPGRTYRIRIINTSALAVYMFAIDGHRMTVIEVDGVDTVPVGPVDSIEIWPAQRYSVLVKMNGTLDSYWIRSTALFVEGFEHLAILEYDYVNFGGVRTAPARRPQLWRSGTQGRREKHDFDWEQVMKDSKLDRPKSELFGVSYNGQYEFPKQLSREDAAARRQIEHQHHKLAMQNVRLPTTEPVVDPIFLDNNLCRPMESRGPASAPNYFDELVVLNSTIEETPNSIAFHINGLPYENHSPPVVMRMMLNTPINETSNPQFIPRLRRVVQVVINNRDPAPHPWHLHGHTFWVVGTGFPESGDFLESRDEGQLNIDGVRRDTTIVQGNSWLVLRFETDNPGAWLLHCHINWHPEVGLAAVFIEGEEELRELYTIPNEAKRVCALNGIEV